MNNKVSSNGGLDMITTFARTLILYFLIIIGLRLMGKRQVGELQPSELVTAILISDLSAVPMQDLGIPLLQGVIPVITLFSIEMILSAVSSRSVKARKVVSGSTSILVHDGRINQPELDRLRINVVELLEELRLKNVFDVTTVDSAFLETNGQLSVLLKPGYQTVVASQMNIDTASEPTSFVTIVAHGKVIDENLRACGRNEEWLRHQLDAAGLKDVCEVYLMVLDDKGGVMCVKKNSHAAMKGEEE